MVNWGQIVEDPEFSEGSIEIVLESSEITIKFFPRGGATFGKVALLFKRKACIIIRKGRKLKPSAIGDPQAVT